MIAPGPATRGIASGKTEMSWLYSSSSWSRTVRDRSPVGRAKIMSSASKKSRIPPAVRNAGNPMLRAPSSPSPTSAKTNKMAAPKAVPRIAASLLRFSEYP